MRDNQIGMLEGGLPLYNLETSKRNSVKARIYLGLHFVGSRNLAHCFICLSALPNASTVCRMSLSLRASEIKAASN